MRDALPHAAPSEQPVGEAAAAAGPRWAGDLLIWTPGAVRPSHDAVEAVLDAAEVRSASGLAPTPSASARAPPAPNVTPFSPQGVIFQKATRMYAFDFAEGVPREDGAWGWAAMPGATRAPAVIAARRGGAVAAHCHVLMPHTAGVSSPPAQQPLKPLSMPLRPRKAGSQQRACPCCDQAERCGAAAKGGVETTGSSPAKPLLVTPDLALRACTRSFSSWKRTRR